VAGALLSVRQPEAESTAEHVLQLADEQETLGYDERPLVVCAVGTTAVFVQTRHISAYLHSIGRFTAKPLDLHSRHSSVAIARSLAVCPRPMEPLT
jgi:hypothetical protein